MRRWHYGGGGGGGSGDSCYCHRWGAHLTRYPSPPIISPTSSGGGGVVGSASFRHRYCCRGVRRPLGCYTGSGRSSVVGEAIYVAPLVRPKRMKTRKLSSTYKMDIFRKKFPNHTEMAYREAVAKLKYFLAESYAPKIALAKPLPMIKRSYKDSIPQPEDYGGGGGGGDDADAQSVFSDAASKRDHQPQPPMTTRGKYYASRLSHFPQAPIYSAGAGSERVAVPPAELSSFIERQEEYIEQLERESQYCREELKNLVEKVREVVAENEALQDKNKSGFFKSVLDSYPTSCEDAATAPKHTYRGDDPAPPATSRKSTRLEGPSIVFESRISELEAQLTQARLELRKAREENQENLERLSDRKEESQLHMELERALREKREFEARTDELQRELAKIRARDTDVEAKSKRAVEVAQQAEFEKSQAEVEVRRLKDELERRQDKLREALQETNRRIMEEKQQVERRFSQQMEQLSQDVASHWEAASKSHLESEKQRREIADLKRELAQKASHIEDLKKELQAKTTKLQEELNQAIAEKDASQEEISTLKLTAERNERQARQEQSRLQSEINSYKMRLERADADLVHARRENLRLTEEVAALEKEINMNKIMEETRVGAQPPKSERPRPEKGDKELASLIYDLENKQAKTVAGLEDSLNKQASLVSRLTAECQSLTQRLEANDQKHKQEMANLQSNIEYLSSKINESFDLREQSTGDVDEKTHSTEQTSTGLITSNSHEENDNNASIEKYNLELNSKPRQKLDSQLDDESIEGSREALDSSSYASQSVEDQNPHQKYSEQPENYDEEYSNQNYDQYNQYDPAQYQEYYNNQQYDENQQYSQDQQYAAPNEQYSHTEQYLDNKENYKEEPYNEQDYNNYPTQHEEK